MKVLFAASFYINILPTLNKLRTEFRKHWPKETPSFPLPPPFPHSFVDDSNICIGSSFCKTEEFIENKEKAFFKADLR